MMGLAMVSRRLAAWGLAAEHFQPCVSASRGQKKWNEIATAVAITVQRLHSQTQPAVQPALSGHYGSHGCMTVHEEVTSAGGIGMATWRIFLRMIVYCD